MIQKPAYFRKPMPGNMCSPMMIIIMVNQSVCPCLVRTEPYRSAHLFPYFFNMLSEGANRQMQSLLLHIDETDDFGIMLATAQYDTIGAVTVKPI